MPRVNRRSLFLAGAAAALGVGGGLGAFAFRVHSTPRRTPYLTDAHLTEIAQISGPAPRVLFIGNSMVLRNDLPARVAALTGATTATAAADGARLIETVRIPALKRVLAEGAWDAIVLQDFTKTPLRGVDRFASKRAMAWIAGEAPAARVLLYPPWPAAAGTPVYSDAGFMTETPATPLDFARRTMTFYSGVAAEFGFDVAPIPDFWLAADSADFYASDGHHPSAAGTQFVAGHLADHLTRLLQ